MRKAFVRWVGLAVAGLVLGGGAGPLAAAVPANDREVDRAYEQALATSIAGPAVVPIQDHAELRLPAGFAFIPAVPARRLLAAIGNSPALSMKGLIVRQGQVRDWYVTVGLETPGHVPKAMFRRLTPDILLQHLRTATARSDGARRELGAGRLSVSGFAAQPKYDEAASRLTFATRVVDDAPTGNDEPVINFAAYGFGRDAIVDLTLVAAESDFAKLLPHLDLLAGGLAFPPGRRAQDFVAGQHNLLANPEFVLFAGMSATEAERATRTLNPDRAETNQPAARAMTSQAVFAGPGTWAWGGIGLLTLLSLSTLLYGLWPRSA